jgi:hypothetical protein
MNPMPDCPGGTLCGGGGGGNCCPGRYGVCIALAKGLIAYVCARCLGLAERGVMEGNGALRLLPGIPKVSDEPTCARRPPTAPSCCGELLPSGLRACETVDRERSLLCAVIARLST